MSTITLRTAESIQTEGVTLDDFEQSLWGTIRLHDRQNFITTFKYTPVYGNRAQTFKVYGQVSAEDIRVVAQFAREQGVQVYYQTTVGLDNKVYMKYNHGSLDWLVAV